MVAYSETSGQPYKLTWRGATVTKEITADVDKAMENLRSDIENYLQQTIHVYTGPHTAPRYAGELRDKSFAVLEARTGGKRKLVVGSDAPHAIFHELRYHPQFRETLDEWAPKVTSYLQAAFRK